MVTLKNARSYQKSSRPSKQETCGLAMPKAPLTRGAISARPDSSLGLSPSKPSSGVRQHQNLPWTAESELVWSGHTEGGEVFDQTGVVSYEGHSCRCRRVVVQLDQPTRDGETQIALLTNLPETDALSLKVAQLYRKRWRIETLFQVATETKQL